MSARWLLGLVLCDFEGGVFDRKLRNTCRLGAIQCSGEDCWRQLRGRHSSDDVLFDQPDSVAFDGLDREILLDARQRSLLGFFRLGRDRRQRAGELAADAEANRAERAHSAKVEGMSPPRTHHT